MPVSYPSSINRQTVITFPLNNSMTDITTGIETGSLYLNKVLFENQLHFGECHPDRFEATLFGVDDDISQETIQVYQLDYTNDPNNPVRTNLFYGVVDSCLKEDNQLNRRLVALDLMYTIGNTDATDWWNTYWEGTFTSTPSALLTSLLSAFSVTLSSDSVTTLASLPTKDLAIMQFSGFQAITFGSVLAKITEILLCNAHFNAEGELELISFGATYNRTSHTIDGEYEDANSHFEAFTTEPITKVVIYGETDEIAGEYGTGDNVYVIKGNPLLYNLADTTYNALAQTIYAHLYNTTSQMAQAGICYTPANVKMIVSKPEIQLGDTILTTHGTSSDSSIVSSIELSGTMLIEQTITSSGNQKLTPDDFNDTSSTAGRALEQATTTSRHFVWVPNEGAFVTTDDTPAGQAPTDNYTKLTEDGLYVTTNGEQVAHFGVDENDQPISILGSTETGKTAVVMSSAGIVASKQVTDTVKSEYFNVRVPSDSSLYEKLANHWITVDGNRGYIEFSTSIDFLDLGYVMWSNQLSTSGTNNRFVAALGDDFPSRGTSNEFDLFIEDLLNSIFKNVSVSSPSPTLRNWFTAYGVSSSEITKTIAISSLSGDTELYVTFVDANNLIAPFANAMYVMLDFPRNFTYRTEDRLLPSTEYTYDPTNPYQIDITNYTYYDMTSKVIPSSIVTGAEVYQFTLHTAGSNKLPRFYPVLLISGVTYQTTIGDSSETNLAPNSIVLGDKNIVTEDSQEGVCVIGVQNEIDNQNFTGIQRSGCFVIGKSNFVESQRAYVFGINNQLNGKFVSPAAAGLNIDNLVIGGGNQLDPLIVDPNTGAFDCSDNFVLGDRNEIEGTGNYCLGLGLISSHTRINGNVIPLIIGRFNETPNTIPNFDNEPALVVGNGAWDWNSDPSADRHNAMEVGKALVLYPTTANALIFDNGGVDRGVNFRYQNDAGGTGANFIRLVPTGTSAGAIMGMSAGGLTVVGGGESADAIATNPGSIGLTTASESLVCSADTAINFISNAQTIANYKKALFGTDGYFQINECSGTGINLAYFDSSGKLKRDSRSFYSRGDSFSGWNLVGLGGYLTSSQKEIVVFLPMPFPPSLISTSGLTIKMTARHTNGGYPYIYNSSTQINGTNVVTNGTKMTGLSTVSFDSRSVSGMTLHLTFANALQRSASSTSTAITNNTPLGIALEISGSFVT